MAQVPGYERTEIAKPPRKHRALDRRFWSAARLRQVRRF